MPRRLTECRAALGGVSQHYWYSGCLIASEIELVDLPVYPVVESQSWWRPEPTYRIRAATRQPPPVPPSHEWRDHRGTVIASLARVAERFILHFPQLATFDFCPDARMLSVACCPGTSIETVRHLLLDQVLPRVIAHEGRLVLHASCVRVGEQAVVFLGDTGQGKSSLAASFDAAGYPLLSDDSLVVVPHDDGPRVLPTYRSLRLWPDSVRELFTAAPRVAPMAHYSTKQRVEVAASAAQTEEPLPLGGIFILRSSSPPPDGPEITPLSGGAGCIQLLRNTFQLDVTDPRRTSKTFAMASELARQVPLFALDYPRRYALLPEVQVAILERASSSEPDALAN